MATARGCWPIDPAEHPVALQLGGSEPRALAECARIAADLGYDEINLNVGCPSDRVQEGRFGACLMAEPALVGDCVAAMKAAVRIPVTVKCRIGIDEQDPEEALGRAHPRGRAGRRRRAHRACAQGLARGPLAAREPRHPAARLRSRLSAQGRASDACRSCSTAASPSLDQAAAHLAHVDGVMMGRAAYQEPWRLLAVDPDAVRRSAAPLHRPRPRPRRSSPISSASLRAARGSTPSPATCSACSAACPARARSAGILRRRRSSRAPDVGTFREALALVLDIDAPSAHIAAA